MTFKVYLVFFLFLYATCSIVKAEEDLKVEVTKRAPENCIGRARDGDYLTIHYTGRFASNGKIFDSSRQKSVPYNFILGRKEVIQGYEIGMQKMCIGEHRKFTMPPHLAYGERGTQGIPPNSTLVFDVELLNIQRDGGVKPDTPPLFGQIDMNGDNKISKEEMLQYLKIKGNLPDDPKKQSQITSDIFDNEDKNKDGFISFDEFSGPKHDELWTLKELQLWKVFY